MSEHLCKNNTCTDTVGARPEETSAYPTSSQLLISSQTGFFPSFVSFRKSVAKSVRSPFVPPIVLFFEV